MQEEAKNVKVKLFWEGAGDMLILHGKCEVEMGKWPALLDAISLKKSDKFPIHYFFLRK